MKRMVLFLLALLLAAGCRSAAPLGNAAPARGVMRHASRPLEVQDGFPC